MKNPINDTILISRKEFESIIFDRFGLKLDFKALTMYVDTFNCNKHAYSIENPNVFTIGYLDKWGFNISNVNSCFYKEEYKANTELYYNFKQFVSGVTFKYKNHYLV